MNKVSAVPNQQTSHQNGQQNGQRTSLPIIHPSAEVSPRASIGDGTRIWHNVQIREGATIGDHCIVGKDVYIDADVQIGNNVKIQNSALIYQGVTLADGVFIGPRVSFTNDLYPRAISPDGTLKAAHDWTLVPTYVDYGASIGAGAIIVAGITIGRFAMVAAGAVVTRSVPPFGLVMGIPARLAGYVCRCGRPLELDGWNRAMQLDGSPRPVQPDDHKGWCTFCQESIDVGESHK
jgi:acetyltransferase-like isoleucine patch superfamily enzyme